VTVTGIVFACALACSLRSLDRLDSASATGGMDGIGGTGAGKGGSSVGGSPVGGTGPKGGATVGGTSSTGGVDPAGGSDAGSDAGGSDAGGSDAGGGTSATGGTASGGARGGGAGSGGSGALGGTGGMGGLAGGGGGGAAGMAGSSSCDNCPLRDETPYLLRPGHDSAKCADLQGFSVDDGTLVQQHTCFNQANQTFWAEDHGSGRFALRSALSGKCIHADGASLSAGANIRQSPCNGELYQLWRPVPEDQRFLLVAVHSGLVLDVSGSAPTNDGAALVQNPADDLLDSVWVFEENSAGAFVVMGVPAQRGTSAARVDEEIRVQTTSGPEVLWKVLPGLANNACVSFESPDDEGRFLRHSGEEMRFEPNDRTAEFAADATFCSRPPLAGSAAQFRALESHDVPGHYVAREGDTVVLSAFVETTEFRAAATWAIRDP
jgi:hypothetical protein